MRLIILAVIFFSTFANAESLKFVEADTKGIPIAECKKVFEEGEAINFIDSVNPSPKIIWYMHDWKVYAFWISNYNFSCDLRGHYE